MRERDTVWIDLAGKLRPAVVLEIQPDLVRVAYGTSNAHEWPRVVVHPETRQGRAFPLQDETFFYGANTTWGATFQAHAWSNGLCMGAAARDPQAD